MTKQRTGSTTSSKAGSIEKTKAKTISESAKSVEKAVSATFGSRNTPAKKHMTMSKRAGIVMPAHKFLKSLKKGHYAAIIQRG